jgi:hypothetical protein
MQDQSKMSSCVEAVQKHREYLLEQNVPQLIDQMICDMLAERPADPNGWMELWLSANCKSSSVSQAASAEASVA